MDNICYLLSGYKSSEGFVGKIVNDLKNEIKNTEKLVYISADFSCNDKNDARFKNTKEWFNAIEINFKESILIDNRIEKEKAQAHIRDASVIYISGGNPKTQMDYINEFELCDSIKHSRAILIGVSAGAINLAKDVIVVKEEDDDIYENYLYKGIGVVNINIEPHFDMNNIKHLEEIKEASLIKEIVCLPNHSYIKTKNNKIDFVGKYYIAYSNFITEENNYK